MDLKKKSQTMDMTKGSPTSLLLRFAMPLFLGNLLQQFYNLVDTSIVEICWGMERLHRLVLLRRYIV